MYVCMCIFVYVCTYLCVHACMRVCSHACMQLCVMYVGLYLFIHAFLYVYFMYVCVCMYCMYRYTHVYKTYITYTCMYVSESQDLMLCYHYIHCTASKEVFLPTARQLARECSRELSPVTSAHLV